MSVGEHWVADMFYFEPAFQRGEEMQILMKFHDAFPELILLMQGIGIVSYQFRRPDAKTYISDSSLK